MHRSRSARSALQRHSPRSPLLACSVVAIATASAARAPARRHRARRRPDARRCWRRPPSRSAAASITKDGVASGKLPGHSAAGALELATQRRLERELVGAFNAYLILRRSTASAHPSTGAEYWETFWVNDAPASQGACGSTEARRQQLLFAAVLDKCPATAVSARRSRRRASRPSGTRSTYGHRLQRQRQAPSRWRARPSAAAARRANDRQPRASSTLTVRHARAPSCRRRRARRATCEAAVCVHVRASRRRVSAGPQRAPRRSPRGAALALAGCGLGRRRHASDVALLVTQGFGAQTIGSIARAEGRRRGHRDADARAQRSPSRPATAAGSSSRSTGSRAAARPRLVLLRQRRRGARSGAAGDGVHHGDHVWWDRHDWARPRRSRRSSARSPSRSSTATAASGCRCGSSAPRPTSSACHAVESVLRRLQAWSRRRAGCCARSTTSRCASWSAPTRRSSADPAAASLIAHGPAASGVYARFEDGGARSQLLDAAGHVVRSAGAGAGLVAATRRAGQPPVWYVTGTDAAGVAPRSRRSTPATLDEHFARRGRRRTTAIPLPTRAAVSYLRRASPLHAARAGVGARVLRARSRFAARS